MTEISQAARARELGISAPAMAKRIRRWGYDAAMGTAKIDDPYARRRGHLSELATPADVAEAPRRFIDVPGYAAAVARRNAHVEKGMWPERAINRDSAINAAEVERALNNVDIASKEA
jgi:hypothetical protein